MRSALAGLGGISLHMLLVVYATLSTAELGSFARSTLEHVRNRWTLTYEVEEEPPPPPPPVPTVEEEPEPPPPTTQPEPSAEPPPPPPTSEAAQVIAQEPDPAEPLDLTGDGFITGKAESYAGGYTSSQGTAKSAAGRRASPIGIVGGTGKPSAAPAPTQDLTKPATWVSGEIMRQCGFPPEADAAQIDFARVVLTVSVGDDGGLKGVAILSETPAGLGFGKRAKSCAYRTTFLPGRDRSGKAVPSTAGPITVNFTRAR